MNDFVEVRLGARFVFVNLLPALFLTLLIGGLIAAGAPQQAPSWETCTRNLSQISWAGAFLVTILIVVASVVLHPLSYPMIQMLEGYWERLPFGAHAKNLVSARHEQWRSHLGQLLDDEEQPPPETAELAWYPSPGTPVLPTRLGNTLRAGELRAGRRYGYDTNAILRSLLMVAPSTIRVELVDTRNQLDTAARVCLASALAVPATLMLLWHHSQWLLLPFGCYLFAWAAYHAAVAAARRFCEALSAAVDLHRLQLWDALSLQRPDGLAAERGQLGPALSRLLDGSSVSAEDRKALIYIEPNTLDVAALIQQTPSPAAIQSRRRRFFSRRAGQQPKP